MIELEHIKRLFHPSVITLVVLLLTGIGALIGYVIRYQFDKKKELVSEVNKERRAVYQQMIDMLLGILEDVKKGKDSDMDKLISDMFSIYRKNVLYASPQVINDFNNFLNHAQSLSKGTVAAPQEVLFKMSQLIGTMRKDLGLSNKGTGRDNRGLLRGMITDIDNY